MANPLFLASWSPLPNLVVVVSREKISRQRPIPQSRRLHAHAVAVVRRPNASDGVADACDGPVGLLDLFAARVTQEGDLAEDLQAVHVLDADGLGVAVDVVPDEHRVLAGPRGDGELDLRMGGRECGELGFYEGAVFQAMLCQCIVVDGYSM